jgi:NADH-quinone oxidoreductase subunit F
MNPINNAAELNALQEKLKAEKAAVKTTISICGGTGCSANHSVKVQNALLDALKAGGLSDVHVKPTGCHGFCEQGPLVVISPQGILYTQVKEADAQEIVDETIKSGNVIERLLFKDPNTGETIQKEMDIPFYAKQNRILLEKNREIDPQNINDYIALGGYSALAKALTSMKPTDVVEEVKTSGIRGRGGAGFPTGIKWGIVASQDNPQKYIVCNADEGDPGAYMDRSLLEGDPHSIIEGMLIGAFAMGASKGYVYVREEYPLAIINLGVAIKQAEEMKLLGDNILGTDFSFHLKIYRGAGAFVCGEETALLESIMGRPGEPRQRPPYPAVEGLNGCPTNINNVETWSNIPHIINNGGEWYANIGTESSKGTKIFSLVGKINNTGLVEVPMGTTLKHIIYDIGGGIPDGKAFKAVQSGGPSGGCIPTEHLGLPIDFDELKKVGAMMGSGGLVVMDEDTCMVDVARYFLDFTLGESCGKCTSCREGNARMLEILEDICAGVASENSLDLLKELSEYIIDTSLCALGQTAPNPVLTTLKYFRDEYAAHINKQECPAKVCKELIYYEINSENCTGCTLCARKCPVEAINGEVKNPHKIDLELCTKCGNCHEVCRFKAVEVKTGGGA